MKPINVSPVRRRLPKVVPLTAGAALTVPSRTVAARASSQDQQVAEQRQDLRAEVAQLKAALAPQTQSMPSAAAPYALPPSMKMMDDMVLDDDTMSALLGVPETSHVYHIGSTVFVLDQFHIVLSGEHKSALNRIKERAMLDRANAARSSARAEQELRTPTGADQPDASKMRAQARGIGELRTTPRLAFIRPLGDAARNLTAEQRSTLLVVAHTPSKREAYV